MIGTLTSRNSDSLVQNMRYREASDNRDKILAPLALALHFVPEFVVPKANDLIDYEKSEERIFLEFTAFMITCSESLDILSQVDTSKTAKPGQPSWVPNYSCAGRLSLIEGTRFNASKTLGDFDSSSIQGMFPFLGVMTRAYNLQFISQRYHVCMSVGSSSATSAKLRSIGTRAITLNVGAILQ